MEKFGANTQNSDMTIVARERVQGRFASVEPAKRREAPTMKYNTKMHESIVAARQVIRKTK